MRRVFIIVFAFSLFLSGCNRNLDATESFSERHESAFEDWVIPGYFIPKQVRVVGLGDSLTQGVGDELKKERLFWTSNI